MKLRGFTLIELIVVMGILAILATIVVIAVNPARQFAASRNAKRASDTRALAQAINQHAANNNGQVYSSLTTTPQVIGTGAGKLDLTATLVPNYLSAIPSDPSGGSATDTKYSVYINASQTIVVDAPYAENSQLISSSGTTNYAITFDGTNDVVTAPDANTLEPLADDWTIEFWAKYTSGCDRDLLYKGQTMSGFTSFYKARMGVNSGCRMYWTFGNDSTNASLYAGQMLSGWNHYALVVERSGNTRGYVNGQVQSTVATPVIASMNSTGTLNIGSLYNDAMDEVRISNVARYSSNFTPSRRFTVDANTMGLWHFDEGVGLSAFDSSGNANHGVLTNGPTWSLGQ